MNLGIDHNVLGFLFFIFALLAMTAILLYDYYKGDKKKAK